VAGNGTAGFSGDDGPATQAMLSQPFAVAVASDGSVFIADTDNHRIRRVGPDGIITTVAGNGTSGFSGDGGPALQATLGPFGVAVGPDGSIYIADATNGRIRQVGPDGIIATFAGNGRFEFSGDGGSATQAGLDWPVGVAVAADGTVYVAETEIGVSTIGNNRVRRIRPDGIITTVAGNGAVGFRGDGGAATQAALVRPRGVAVGPNGSLYIA